MLGIRRRKFISFLGGAAAWPVVAWAQQARHVPTIGFVAPTNPLMPSRSTGAFLQRLRELGWIEGQTITIESRWAAGRPERLDEIAAEFIRLKVDVIVTHNTPPVIAAKQATSVIPIVFALANPIHTTHRLELRTIDRDPLATHQAQGMREPHKFRASFGHRLAMHPPELSDRLVIGNQPAQQPHHFHIALALSFQPARGPNLPQVPVQIQFQQIARVVTRTSSFSRFGANETQLRHVQPTHKRLDYTADMILWNQIVQGRWKQGVLTTLLAFDISHSAMPSFARIFASLFSDPQWVS